VLRVPEVDVSVEVDPLMPELVPELVLGVVVVSVVVVVLVLGEVVVLGVVVVVALVLGVVAVVPEPVAPEVLPLVPEVVPEVPELDVVEVSVLVVPVVLAPKFELLVVAGVPVPAGVVAPGDCDIWFGPWPVAAPVAAVPDVPVDDCANDTPTTAARDAAAAAMVKLFGSLLMRDLLLQGETEVAMGCPLQRSAMVCRRAKSFGRGYLGKLRAFDARSSTLGR
jgi:hypothetical protein